MSLRTTEGGQNQTVFSISTDESKLRQLFDDIDFEHCGMVSCRFRSRSYSLLRVCWSLSCSQGRTSTRVCRANFQIVGDGKRTDG